MAIQTRALGTYTEIYSDKNGGGESETYITEAKTTMFHSFFRTKILAPDESVSDFTEVTEAERQSMLEALAAWKRPPQSFIDHWNVIWGDDGCYNESTGFFEGNTLTDLTYQQALDIDYAGNIPGYYGQEIYTRNENIRTNLPCVGSYSWADLIRAFLQCRNLEVANIRYSRIDAATFAHCDKLRKIIGTCQDSSRRDVAGCFFKCFALEEIEDLSIRHSSEINFSDCPLLNLATFKRIILRYNSASQYMITVHADVYAKLTGDTTNPACADLSPEELAKWTALPALAAEKNITFVSA